MIKINYWKSVSNSMWLFKLNIYICIDNTYGF